MNRLKAALSCLRGNPTIYKVHFVGSVQFDWWREGGNQYNYGLNVYDMHAISQHDVEARSIAHENPAC